MATKADGTAGLRAALAENLIGVADVALLAEPPVQEKTVRQWKWRGLLPEPDFAKGGKPLWFRETILEWLYETGRRARKGR